MLQRYRGARMTWVTHTPGEAAWRRAVAGLAVGSILALLACAPAPEAAGPQGVTTIGGASYRLPDEVFADGLVERGPQDSLLLELLVPTATGEAPTAVRVLLVAPFTSDAQVRAKKVQDAIALGASISVSLDPHRQGGSIRQASQRVPDAPAGLVQVVIDTSDSVAGDLFLRPPISNTGEFIRCDRPGRNIIYPLCSQQFAGPGFRVEASYPRAQLPDWEHVRTFILAYLQQHRINQ